MDLRASQLLAALQSFSTPHKIHDTNLEPLYQIVDEVVRTFNVTRKGCSAQDVNLLGDVSFPVSEFWDGSRIRLGHGKLAAGFDSNYDNASSEEEQARRRTADEPDALRWLAQRDRCHSLGCEGHVRGCGGGGGGSSSSSFWRPLQTPDHIGAGDSCQISRTQPSAPPDLPVGGFQPRRAADQENHGVAGGICSNRRERTSCKYPSKSQSEASMATFFAVARRRLAAVQRLFVERFGRDKLTSAQQFESIALGLALIGRAENPQEWAVAA